MEILQSLNFVLSIAIGLFLLVVLVVVHELGHAIAARRNGVVVEEFGIGFPPKAWAKKLKNGIVFSLNWLPLGGFVKLQGEHDAATKKGDYGAASLWVKTKILLAGVVINWLTAVGLFTILAITGLPQVLPNQFTVAGDTTEVRQPVSVTAVAEGSVAKKTGLQVGDSVHRFNNQPVSSPSALTNFVQNHKGEKVTLTYERDGQQKTSQLQLPAAVPKGEGILGVGLGQEIVTRSTWSAPIVGIATTGQLTWATLQGLGSLVANLVTGLASQLSFNQETRQEGSAKVGEAGAQVAGPVRILGVIFPAAREAGFTTLLMLTAVISLTLAVMNTLPIPALDGGRLFVTVLFRALGKKLTKEREEKIHGTGFMVLMVLIVLITVADVGQLFK